MRFIAILLITGSFMLAFQNCGETARDGLFYDQQSSSYLNEECLTTTCVSKENHLWLKILDYDPLKIKKADFDRVGMFNVGGECGSSSYENHAFIWTLRQSFGSQAVVGSKEVFNRCVNGQFSVPIEPTSLLQANQRYQLSLEIVGIDEETFERVSNPMPSNSGNLDVVITTEL